MSQVPEVIEFPAWGAVFNICGHAILVPCRRFFFDPNPIPGGPGVAKSHRVAGWLDRGSTSAISQHLEGIDLVPENGAGKPEDKPK